VAISDGHPEPGRDGVRPRGTRTKRVGSMRDVSVSIVDPAALVAAVVLILFALTH
jgi:hypothetical protein